MNLPTSGSDVKEGEKVSPTAESTSDSATSVSSSSDESSSSTSAGAATEEPPTLKKPAGPLGEIEVEAAKVAEELYPEAAAIL